MFLLIFFNGDAVEFADDLQLSRLICWWFSISYWLVQDLRNLLVTLLFHGHINQIQLKLVESGQRCSGAWIRHQMRWRLAARSGPAAAGHGENRGRVDSSWFKSYLMLWFKTRLPYVGFSKGLFWGCLCPRTRSIIQICGWHILAPTMPPCCASEMFFQKMGPVADQGCIYALVIRLGNGSHSFSWKNIYTWMWT